jgi:hypothetical protein
MECINYQSTSLLQSFPYREVILGKMRVVQDGP